MYFYLYPSDEFSHFQLILIDSSYVVLLHHCLSWGESCALVTMFNPATFLYASPKSVVCSSVVIVGSCLPYLLKKFRKLVGYKCLFSQCIFSFFPVGLFESDYQVWVILIFEILTVVHNEMRVWLKQKTYSGTYDEFIHLHFGGMLFH